MRLRSSSGYGQSARVGSRASTRLVGISTSGRKDKGSRLSLDGARDGAPFPGVSSKSHRGSSLRGVLLLSLHRDVCFLSFCLSPVVGY